MELAELKQQVNEILEKHSIISHWASEGIRSLIWFARYQPFIKGQARTGYSIGKKEAFQAIYNQSQPAYKELAVLLSYNPFSATL